MTKLNCYLAFNGNCEEALNFYKKIFNGEITYLTRYGENPVNTPEEHKNKIMHSNFVSEGVNFMASDGPPDFKGSAGGNVSLMLDFSDEKEEERVFKAFAEGGTVTTPLADVFWGAKFGMVTDRFGISWMLNFTKVAASSN